jgi:hypothetical protein
MTRCQVVSKLHKDKMNLKFKLQDCHGVLVNTEIWMCLWKKLAGENGTESFKKCKQLFEYQQLLLLREIWLLKAIIYN